MPSGEQKTRLEENQEPVTDDWYEDWEPRGRGLEYNRQQDVVRCLYCRRDLVILTKKPILREKVIYQPPTQNSNTLGWPYVKDGIKMNATSRHDEDIFRLSLEKCRCRNIACQTLWAMSGEL